MLRKDVKLGFAIGGVLLAVFIVYVLVIGGSDPKPQVALATDNNRVADPTPTIDVKPMVNPPIVPPTTVPSDSLAHATPPKPVANEDVWATALNRGVVMMTPTATPDKSTENPGGSIKSEPEPARNEPSHAPLSSVDTPAATQPTHPAPAAARTHVIQAGETLASISQMAYGSPNHYKEIIRANPGIDERHLKRGATITLPAISDAKSSPAGTPSDAPASSSIDTKTQYRVESGDSLHRICMKLYGVADKARVDKLYELNKDTIGTDPAKLKLHMLLKLPEAPTQTPSR